VARVRNIGTSIESPTTAIIKLVAAAARAATTIPEIPLITIHL
jgi:hypothetical protein